MDDVISKIEASSAKLIQLPEDNSLMTGRIGTTTTAGGIKTDR